MSVLSPPARAASLHLAFLPLCAALPADKLRKPGHLQNAPLQSHPPRGQQDLLPEDEEKGLGEPEGRAEAEGAEILWQLKNKHRGHRPVRPQEPPRSLISGTRSRAVWGQLFKHHPGTAQPQTPLLPAVCRLGIQHSTLEKSRFALELSFPKSTQVT